MKSPSYNLITIKGYNCILVFLAYLTSHADTFAHVSIAAIRTVSEFSPCWKIPRPEIILLVCDHNTPQVMARSAGLEPATFGLEIRCSIQLSYERMVAPRGLEPLLSLQEADFKSAASANSATMPCRSSGTRTHNQQIKSLLLYQLSYGPLKNSLTRTRTLNPLVNSQMLYLLSYQGMVGLDGIEPSTNVL